MIEAGGKYYDAPPADLLTELAIGRRMMPESLRAVIISPEGTILTPVDSRVLYVHIHRCSRR